MVPSSIQWTMTPSDHILVYPISKYVISPVKKFPETTVKRVIQSREIRANQTSSTIHRCKKPRVHRFSENCSNHQYRRSQQHCRMETYPTKQSPYHRSNGNKSRYEKCCRSQMLIHCSGNQALNQIDEQDEDVEFEEEVEGVDEKEEEVGEEEEEEVKFEDFDYDDDDDNFNDEDYNDEDEEEDDNEDEFKDLVLGQKRKRLDDVDDNCSSMAIVDDATTCWGPQLLIGEKENRVTRYSANVVLLAHGNRSLHVLTIQRNQVISIASNSFNRFRNHRSSSTTMISYKLPGGQFILTEDEPKNYQNNAGNTCTCPDDQQWYSAAIKHLITQLTIRGPATTAMTIMEKSSDDQSQFVLLGNWYRTQQDDDYKSFLVTNGTRCHRHRPSNNNYYPYKPAHVSRRLAGHKRVYAVPDACRLFPGTESTFRLQTPLVKTKTATTKTKTAITTTTITTTYKCKFVPLARLHENSRMYGPVLSSLPAVLSGMNLICSP